jgi:hypothetical protein
MHYAEKIVRIWWIMKKTEKDTFCRRAPESLQTVGNQCTRGVGEDLTCHPFEKLQQTGGHRAGRMGAGNRLLIDDSEHIPVTQPKAARLAIERRCSG